MRTEKAQKVELIVSQDGTRAHMCCARLDVEDKCLVATNGHALVKIPVSIDDGDTTGPVEVSALKAARKLSKGGAPVTIASGTSLVLADGTRMLRPDRGQFPSYKHVIPANAGCETVEFTLSAHLLWELCQALGGSKGAADVKLTVVVPSAGAEMLDPIIVRGGDDPEALGVIMPCRL